VFNVDNNLPARYRPNSAWVAHWAVWNATRQFSVASGAQAGAFWVNLGSDVRPVAAGQASGEQLLGRSLYESSAMTNSVTTSAADVLIC
jgi:hypothetical protein